MRRILRGKHGENRRRNRTRETKEKVSWRTEAADYLEPLLLFGGKTLSRCENKLQPRHKFSSLNNSLCFIAGSSFGERIIDEICARTPRGDSWSTEVRRGGVEDRTVGESTVRVSVRTKKGKLLDGNGGEWRIWKKVKAIE